MTTSRAELRQLTAADAAAIRNWPPYPAEFALLDYALRAGGWLDMFPESQANARFAVLAGGVLGGFTILAGIAGGAAEFYVALHPEHLHAGLGRSATQLTIAHGFTVLDLTRIHLKVRTWHARAQQLYASVGFRPVGECVAPIQGEPVRFVTMERRRESTA